MKVFIFQKPIELCMLFKTIKFLIYYKKNYSVKNAP